MLLDRLQANFAAALLDADATPSLLPLLSSHDTRSVQRLGLYRGNVHAAWDKALTCAYPVVHALVGEEFFAALARAYGRRHPSTNGDLNEFGAQFSEFMRTYEQAQALPYLPDVAALEALVRSAHYAADPPVLARERLAVISPHDLLAARFTLHPACAWMQSRFPIATIWRAHQPGSADALPESLDVGEWALVTRPRWHASVLRASAAEIAALARLREGGDMDAAIGAALALDVQFDFARALLRWLDIGALAEVHL